MKPWFLGSYLLQKYHTDGATTIAEYNSLDELAQAITKAEANREVGGLPIRGLLPDGRTIHSCSYKKGYKIPYTDGDYEVKMDGFYAFKARSCIVG